LGRDEHVDGSVTTKSGVAVALAETSKTFRELRGHVGMPKLVTAHRVHDATLSTTSVDAQEKAASLVVGRHPISPSRDVAWNGAMLTIRRPKRS
jgi:hypothetical protein